MYLERWLLLNVKNEPTKYLSFKHQKIRRHQQRQGLHEAGVVPEVPGAPTNELLSTTVPQEVAFVRQATWVDIEALAFREIDQERIHDSRHLSWYKLVMVIF